MMQGDPMTSPARESIEARLLALADEWEAWIEEGNDHWSMGYTMARHTAGATLRAALTEDKA